MLILQNIVSGVEQLWANKMRSVLTVIGVIIAVSSVITVVAIIQGFSRYVTDFLQGMGTNAMWVWPQRPPGEDGKRLGRIEMKLADVQAVERRCSAVETVAPLIMRSVKVKYGDRETDTQLTGTTDKYQLIRNFDVDLGRCFGPIDMEHRRHACVVGRDVLRKLEIDTTILGGHLQIAGQRFRVVGILKSKGSFMGESQDDTVLIPFTTALKLFPEARRFVGFMARAKTPMQVPEAKAQIINTLRHRHGLSAVQPNDFNIQTQDEVLREFNRISLVATVVLSGIVGISLLVGGVGIMNVMLVSVTERTREVGLRKAVGARRRDIMAQFLTEAALLSSFGGGIGIAIGYAACYVASMHPKMVNVTVPWWAVGLGFGFSAAVGIVFGIVPAFKAAILHPIDALRHE